MTGQPLITCFNAQKFHYITFSSKESFCLSNVYINPELNIINPSSEVLDLGVYMSSNCTFDFHVSCVYKRCSNLSGWILRTFSTRETRTMMTLFKIPGTIPAGLCLTIVVTPSIKICLTTREGTTLIYRTHHRDAYYVLWGATEAPESPFYSEEARHI